jgi:hypothetical protein
VLKPALLKKPAINRGRAADVGADAAFGEQHSVGVIGGVWVINVLGFPIHHGAAPVEKRVLGDGLAGFFAAEVVRQAIGGIVGVKLASHGELPFIVEAGNTLSFHFGSGERGEEEAGENGDDGNNDEQFDQRETRKGTLAIADAADLLPPRNTHLMKQITRSNLYCLGLDLSKSELGR